MSTTTATLETRIRPGIRVEVRSRYLGSWSRGFEVASFDGDGYYTLRRLSDRALLPAAFHAQEVRVERFSVVR